MSGYQVRGDGGLGSVDLDLGCSTILPNHTASSANFPSAQSEPGRMWNCQNHSQPTTLLLFNRIELTRGKSSVMVMDTNLKAEFKSDTFSLRRL